jgi:hypothetical protein
MEPARVVKKKRIRSQLMAIKFGDKPKHSGKNAETSGVGHGKSKKVANSKGKSVAKSKTQMRKGK